MKNIGGRAAARRALADIEAKLQQAKNTLAEMNVTRQALDRIYGLDFCASHWIRQERLVQEEVAMLENERAQIRDRLRD